MPLDQASRTLGLSTPLGDNELLLTGFRGQEEMSRLFSFQLDMISDNNAITAADIVGKNVTFSVKLADESPRFFNGFVRRFYAGDEDENGRRNYRAEIVPWLWFLARTTDCRIFQNKTVPQIIEQIFGDLGFSDFKLQASGNHPQREYVVQYRESDFHFVSRLMEEEGMYYFFEHADGAHNMVIADNPGAYVDCGENEVSYPHDFGSRAMEAHITSWEHRYEFRTGKIAQTDYNFKTPSTSLMTNSDTMVDLPGNDKYEFYDYPGIYGNSGDGRALVDVRMEEEEAEYDVVEGSSLCKTFSPGGKFKIKRHRSSSEEGNSYVLTSVAHSASEVNTYETGPESEAGYENTFTCIPAAVSFRPARTTRKPFVQGVQTAVVVGPGGEEIFTDEFGRVKVQFFWDRKGKKDENSSCWIRVSQNWAGQNWGVVFNPRIGQEVIVDFIEGDPDRPIITGRVYNAEQMPPYALPGEQTKSTIKSRSSKGGGPDNFNEIRFEDKMGSEEMYIHAEKDQNTVVENDQTIEVGNDRMEGIARDRTLTVGRDKSETVQRNKKIHVAGKHDETVDETMTIMVGGALAETVAVSYVETVGAAMQLSVGAAYSVSVGAAMSEAVGGTKSETVGGSKSENIGKGKTLEVGKDLTETIKETRTVTIGKDFKVQVDGEHQETVKKDYMVNAKRIQFKADDQITLKTGSAEIVMKKNGDINIKGKKISVKGSGDVVIKGSKIKEN